MSYPKHKPALTDERSTGGRNQLYAPNPDSKGKGKNWEGIEEAKARGNQTKTPEQVSAAILHRLYARLRVASGTTRHIDKETGRQVRVDTKVTRNLIGNLVKVAKGIKSEELRADISAQVQSIRQNFRDLS